MSKGLYVQIKGQCLKGYTIDCVYESQHIGTETKVSCLYIRSTESQHIGTE